MKNYVITTLDFLQKTQAKNLSQVASRKSRYSTSTFHSLNSSPESSPDAASFGLDFGQRKGKLLYARSLLILLMLFALAACNVNDYDHDYTTETTVSEPHTNEDVTTEYFTIAELEIQISAADIELLNGFSNLFYANVAEPGDGEGSALVVWANQNLFNFYIRTLEPIWLEGRDEWGFRPTNSFGSVSFLQHGDAFVIENYAGAGTLPSRGINFIDADMNMRTFFFQQNHAYLEHGEQWIIREIEEDRLIWDFSYDVAMPNEVVINGVAFDMYNSADAVYFAAGQLPTHITMSVLPVFGIDVVQGSSQISLMHNGKSIGVWFNVLNYLAGTTGTTVGINDVFMADDGYFTQYIPLSLLRALGLDVYFEGSRTHINGQVNITIRPHPIATAVQTFIASATGETKALVLNVGGYMGVLAIEFVDDPFVDDFVTATLFVHTGAELLYKEMGSIDAFPLSVGFDIWGNLIKITGDGATSSYTMFSVATNPATLIDEIVYLFTIYAERLSDGTISYYRFDGGWLEGIMEEGRYPITEEQFNGVLSAMGDMSSWRDFPDDTMSILNWVADFYNWHNY